MIDRSYVFVYHAGDDELCDANATLSSRCLLVMMINSMHSSLLSMRLVELLVEH